MIKPKEFLRQCLTGIGQVFLQQSSVTGAFFLLGVLVSSPLMAAGAVFAVIVATAFAHAMKYPRDNIDAGLYGFNAVLVGIALPYFFTPSFIIAAMVAVGSIASAALIHWQLKKFPLPAYTSAFVVTAWVLYYVALRLSFAPASHSSYTDVIPDFGVLDGVGQVMFQQNVATGVLFLVGIACYSRPAALWALGGSAVGLVCGLALGAPQQLIEAGIFSYNGVLCGVALAGGKGYRGAAWPVICAALSVPLLMLFQKAGFPALTAPFVIASWLCVYIRQRFG